jgi:peptide-methionine (S)-S-oxide reductase
MSFYYAEDYHQQYLDKNPRGYCNMHGTGIACSITGTSGLGVDAH